MSNEQDRPRPVTLADIQEKIALDEARRDMEQKAEIESLSGNLTYNEYCLRRQQAEPWWKKER